MKKKRKRKRREEGMMAAIFRKPVLVFVCVAVLAVQFSACSRMMSEHPMDRDKSIFELLYAAYYFLPVSAVSGKVYLCGLDNTGNPNVKITLSGFFESHVAYTDSGGEFSIPNVRAGYYTLTASKAGQRFAPETLLVASGAGDVRLDTIITWDKKLGGPGWEKAYSARQCGDCGYVVAGYTDSHDIGNLDFYIVKLDMFGNLEWEKRFGGSNSDVAYSVSQTSDGGYIAAGYTYSYGAGVRDYWVIKLNSAGERIWDRTYGGASWDDARAIRPTADKGYIVAGYTESFGAGVSDYWAIKLDESGNIVWNQTYGGALTDEAYSIQVTHDGGYVLCGITEVAGTGDNDVKIIKIDPAGNVQWTKQYNRGINDEANEIQVTDDGGYIVAGFNGENPGQCWILKLDSGGDLQWDNTYGNSYVDKAYSIQQTDDGGYIIAGYTYSYDTTDNDILLIKLDPSGNLEWQRTFDDVEGNEDVAYSVRQTSDGGYIVAGYTTLYSKKIDIWLLKLNRTGEIVP